MRKSEGTGGQTQNPRNMGVGRARMGQERREKQPSGVAAEPPRGGVPEASVGGQSLKPPAERERGRAGGGRR